MSSQLNKVRKFFAPEQGYDTSQPPPPPPKWLTEGLSRRQSSSSSEVKKAFERQPSYDDLAMGSFNEPSPFANPAVSRRKGNDTDIGEIDDELTSSLLESIGKRKSPGKAPEISRESSQHVSQIPPSELHTPPSPTAAYLPAASEGDDLDLDEPDQEPPTAPHYGGQHYEPNDGYAEEQQAPAYDQQAQEPYYSEQDYYAPDEQQAAADPYAAPAADYGYDNQAYPQQDMGYQEQEPYYEQQPQDAYGQQQDYSN